MKTIREFENKGYEGGDASLSISLFENGLIWKRDEEKNEIRFIYRNQWNKFSWSDFKLDCDPRKEFNWVNWADVASFVGQSVDEFLKQDLPDIIYSLFLYYGSEDVFGTDYSGGWEMQEDY